MNAVITVTECDTCDACTIRRQAPMPELHVPDSDPRWAAWMEAEEAANMEDCHCDHATCVTLDSAHDYDCDQCEHRFDADEDYDRER